MPSLPGDVDADVAIVGAGYTGLWTAYALCTADPSLRVVVCERETVGFGASGRNGGWCSAFFAGSRERTIRQHGRDAAIAMQRAMFDTLDEIERVVADGEHRLRLGARRQRATSRRCPRTSSACDEELADHRGLGLRRRRLPRCSNPTRRGRASAARRTSARCSRRTARRSIPRSSCTGWRAAVERARRDDLRAHAGRSRSTTGRVRTPRGTVRADVVVRATEAFTPDAARPAARARAGLLADDRDRAAARRVLGRRRARTSATDVHRLPPHVIYGQRTADGRFAFGGRGAPYHLGSRIRPKFDDDADVFDALHAHAAVAVPGARRRRDHAPLGRRGRRAARLVPVGRLRSRRRAWRGPAATSATASSTTNLAGRTIADLVLGRDTDIAHLPWVGHVSPQWEPEPLRWLGVNGTRMLVDVDRPGRSEGSRSAPAGGVRGARARCLNAISRSSAWAAAGVRGARRSARSSCGP